MSKILRFFFIYIALMFVVISILPLLLTLNAPAPSAENQEPSLTYLDKGGNLAQIPLEDFVLGVVAAEMPTSFAPAALEAQAVAARSYIYYCTLHPKHGEASVCTDHTCCQAYTEQATLATKWGDNSQAALTKLQQAVEATAGVIVTYNNQPVSTPYFSTCGGYTENSEDVWSKKLPYLRSVQCLWDAAAPRYHSQAVFSLDEAARLLQSEPQAVAAMATTAISKSGRVKEVIVGEEKLSGSRIRSLLGLNSTAFSWTADQDSIVFEVQGFGHGVGLCQHGAAGLAQAGYSYQEILKHYYSGIELSSIY